MGTCESLRPAWSHDHEARGVDVLASHSPTAAYRAFRSPASLLSKLLFLILQSTTLERLVGHKYCVGNPQPGPVAKKHWPKMFKKGKCHASALQSALQEIAKFTLSVCTWYCAGAQSLKIMPPLGETVCLSKRSLPIEERFLSSDAGSILSQLQAMCRWDRLQTLTENKRSPR